jgi:hypothetical protein
MNCRPRFLIRLVSLLLALTCGSSVAVTSARDDFDIAPFALPGSEPGEIRFEEVRDIVAVNVDLDGTPPAAPGLSYLQDNWPGTKLEFARDQTQPCQFGWTRVDDWFNAH